MFKIEGFFQQLIVTFLLYTGLIFFFQAIGWFEVNSDLSTSAYWLMYLKTFGLIMLVELVVTVVILTAIAIGSVVNPVITCVGITALFLFAPFLNYKILEFAGSYTHLFTMVDSWWQMWIIGFSFSIFSATSPSSKSEEKPKIDPQVAVAGRYNESVAGRYNEAVAVHVPAAVVVEDGEHCAHCGQKVLASDRCCPFCGASL